MNHPDWSPQQEQAFRQVAEWISFPKDKQVFRLFGYAGTGKTTLARHLAELAEPPYYFATFTGKAASVLERKGCRGASTIHRLIYTPKDKSRAKLAELEEQLEKEEDEDKKNELRKLIKEENANLSRPSFVLSILSPARDANLIVVDEVSMVGEPMGRDLLSFGNPVLVLGDPAQLPPVRGTGYFTEQEPDVLLTDIHRQALNSPIIQLATSIRQGETPAFGDYGEACKVLPKGVLSIDDLAGFSQILVGKNNTRRVINHRLREEVFKRDSHLPEPGDKLVCLRNNHDQGLLNGGLWHVLESQVIDDLFIGLTVQDPESEDTVSTVAHRAPFESKDIPFYMRKEADEFDYGYVMTVHKAQGSQWKNVLVIDESHVFPGSRDRWLYTAVTRAEEGLTIVREP